MFPLFSAPRGSIAFGDDESAQDALTQLMRGSGKEKEALVRLRKSVVDAFLQSNVDIDVSKMVRIIIVIITPFISLFLAIVSSFLWSDLCEICR